MHHLARILGIDLGATKTGIALSDQSGTLAFAHTTLHSKLMDVVDQITKISLQNECATIVLGLPSRECEWRNTILQFKKNLEVKLASEVVIEFEDENFSTSEALTNIKEIKQHSKSTQHVKMLSDDAESARIILQRYLDRHN